MTSSNRSTTNRGAAQDRNGKTTGEKKWPSALRQIEKFRRRNGTARRRRRRRQRDAHLVRPAPADRSDDRFLLPFFLLLFSFIFFSFGVDAPEEKPEKWRRLQLRNVADDRRGAALRRTRGRCETVTSRKNEKKKKTSAGEAFFLFFFAWKLFLSLAQWFNLWNASDESLFFGAFSLYFFWFHFDRIVQGLCAFTFCAVLNFKCTSRVFFLRVGASSWEDIYSKFWHEFPPWGLGSRFRSSEMPFTSLETAPTFSKKRSMRSRNGRDQVRFRCRFGRSLAGDGWKPQPIATSPVKIVETRRKSDRIDEETLQVGASRALNCRDLSFEEVDGEVVQLGVLGR